MSGRFVRFSMRMLSSLVVLAFSLPAVADSWPELPSTNATVMLPVQPSPYFPGPRKVKVYVHYPGKSIKNVGPRSGLMLSLHNWGGTYWSGTADPNKLAERYNVVAICVDYLQSSDYEARSSAPYDFGYLQALDALRALYFVFDGLEKRGTDFARGRIYATGGSGGGNVTQMVNKFAPRTFACVLDMCGMARLSDDIAFDLEGGSRLYADYSRDPSSPNYLTKDAQELRFVGQPRHLKKMKELGNRCKIIVVHGATDIVCSVADKREMVRNMRETGQNVEPHFITGADLDGKVLANTGHALGDRTLIVFRFADKYLMPDVPDALARKGKCDFELRDRKVRYTTQNGQYVISYEAGFPVGRFEK